MKNEHGKHELLKLGKLGKLSAAQLKQLIIDNGSLSRIAELSGVSRQRVSDAAKILNVKVLKGHHIESREKYLQLQKEYRTCKAIAEHLGISKYTVQGYGIRFGLSNKLLKAQRKDEIVKYRKSGMSIYAISKKMGISEYLASQALKS